MSTLVLKRKVGQGIVIDQQVKVEVIGIDKGKVRLAIQAPSGIPIRSKQTSELSERRITMPSQHRRIKNL
ncbi:carbon storage regulator [Pseudoteredinibacter isoporae]|uniref:Carbon storage regulator CsrA n=1 Tax=Pseudoteredinibacter isoporae TaxID=570281 RepID=A0A7X0MXB8_9GAMM|nr:carbon storage regulator [Pseudoteredinibacter isoporae]MBB6521884.1 carbon storage regulator CsrA [Pseudoteredinibacter isoporae]NHO87428.1 carbon storage regulator [Pseudoteredinibacter isoporae]NIB24241.1 carbon storage regulator [Pseudoteredinibacter isoporae]